MIWKCPKQDVVPRTLILEDPGALSGGGKKAKRARKKIGRRKVKKEIRSPWDSSLNRPVPKPFKILACDWAQKYFLCPIRVQLFSCYFRDFLCFSRPILIHEIPHSLCVKTPGSCLEHSSDFKHCFGLKVEATVSRCRERFS